MAKKGNRQVFGLICTVCKLNGYISERNKVNTPDKIVIKKYCKTCRKRTEHKENSKLK
jgi:large subunit ribosomal protein L33